MYRHRVQMSPPARLRRWPASTCVARSCPPPGCGPRCRAVASTWTRWCPRSARSSTRSPNAVPRPPSSTAKTFDGVRPAARPSARRTARRRAGRPRPERARRARGRHRARPRRARRSAPHRHHDDARARRHGHRTLGAGRAGRPLRARRQRRLPVERGDERGAGADRRGRLPGDRQPAAGRSSAGLPHPTILAAARLLGVDEVWAVGGAQAVALLAYGGTDTDGAELAPVDMITGPGNIYVTAAKRICRSQVGIDAEAGPTEIAILADHTADPVARGRRPDQPGRARRDGRQRARHRQRRARRRHRPRTRRPAGDHRAPRSG